MKHVQPSRVPLDPETDNSVGCPIGLWLCRVDYEVLRMEETLVRLHSLLG